MIENEIEEDSYLVIETECFPQHLTEDNIRYTNAKLTTIDDDGEIILNWTCQQFASLINALPSWTFAIKSKGMGSSKIKLQDPNDEMKTIKAQLYPNFNITVKADIFWIIKFWSQKSNIKKVTADSRNRPYKKSKSRQLIFYQLCADIQNNSTNAICNELHAIFYPLDFFGSNFNHFCHYLYYQKKKKKKMHNYSPIN